MSAESRTPGESSFRLGINYWPARTAMSWWTAYDETEVASDFSRIARCGFDSVRIFLTWEDFQPTPSTVATTMVDRLVSTLNQAARVGLSVMPTLFTGHMSGVNWLPPWALTEGTANPRFRVFSGGQIVSSGLANWYSDASIMEAQCLLARELAGALAGHSALWAWDLGNENSNCVVPPNKDLARQWLIKLTDTLRTADPCVLITLGLHMEDLEENRTLGPREAAEVCDFLTMHGYPGYAAWADSPTDERVLPFLARLTQWLGDGADVFITEFGVPTSMYDHLNQVSNRSIESTSGPALIEEPAAASYLQRGLKALLECGSSGAMLWCHSDYAEPIWKQPPLDLAFHERSFGLWRADSSPKPAVAMIQTFAQQRATCRADPNIADTSWIDIDSDEFYLAPGSQLRRLYQRYCLAMAMALADQR